MFRSAETKCLKAKNQELIGWKPTSWRLRKDQWTNRSPTGLRRETSCFALRWPCPDMVHSICRQQCNNTTMRESNGEWKNEAACIRRQLSEIWQYVSSHFHEPPPTPFPQNLPRRCPIDVPRLTCPYKWYAHLSERLYKCKKETSLRVSTSKTFKILNISQKYQVLIADYNPAFK